MKYILLMSMIIAIFGARILDQWPISYNNNIMQVFTQIQERLQGGQSVDDIHELLNEIKDRVLEEGKKHTDVQDKQIEECKSEVSFRKKEIADSTLVRDASKQSLSRLDKRMGQLLEELKYAKEELYRDETELEVKINRRRHQKEQFVKKIEDHNDAIVSLNECIEIVDEIYAGGASFVQLAQNSRQMLKHAVTLKQTKEYAPMLSVLAQVAAEQDRMLSDQQALIKIKNFIKRIGDRIKGQKSQFMEMDQIDEARFSGEKVRLEGEIEEGKKFIEDTEEEIEQVTQLIAEQTAINEFACAKIDLNKKLLDDVIVMCETFNREYDISIKKRLNEVKLIEKLNQLIESKRKVLNEGFIHKGTKAAETWQDFVEREYYEASDYEMFK